MLLFVSFKQRLLGDTVTQHDSPRSGNLPSPSFIAFPELTQKSENLTSSLS